MAIFLTCIVLLMLIRTSYTETADYNDQSNWSGSCQNGTRQSPINLVTNSTHNDSSHRFQQRLFDGNSLLNPSGIDLKNSFSGGSLIAV